MNHEEFTKGPAVDYVPSIQAKNVNQEFHGSFTLGQKVADNVARIIGSWKFIILQTLAILIYIVVNIINHDPWDPYPFILLNLVLAVQAAYTGPVVMMSQNRQSEKDRLIVEEDFRTDVKAQEQIEVIIKQLAHNDKMILELLKQIHQLKSELKKE